MAVPSSSRRSSWCSRRRVLAAAPRSARRTHSRNSTARAPRTSPVRLAPPLALTPRLAHPTRPRPDRDPRPRATADTDATPPSHGANGLREASSSEAPPLGWLPRRKRIAQLSGRLAVAFRVRRDVPDFASFIPRLLHQQLLPTELGGGARRVGPGLEFAGDGAGRLLHAAAIFSDASGFTALTERLAQQPNGAEVMCRTMNRFLSAMINIIHSYGGDVVKFAGDALLVVFPIDAAQVPRCACHATAPPRRGLCTPCMARVFAPCLPIAHLPAWPCSHCTTACHAHHALHASPLPLPPLLPLPLRRLLLLRRRRTATLPTNARRRSRRRRAHTSSRRSCTSTRRTSTPRGWYTTCRSTSASAAVSFQRCRARPRPSRAAALVLQLHTCTCTCTPARRTARRLRARVIA